MRSAWPPAPGSPAPTSPDRRESDQARFPTVQTSGVCWAPTHQRAKDPQWRRLQALVAVAHHEVSRWWRADRGGAGAGTATGPGPGRWSYGEIWGMILPGHAGGECSPAARGAPAALDGGPAAQWGMRLLGSVSEDDMVAAFLAAEATSENYGPQIRQILVRLGQPHRLV